MLTLPPVARTARIPRERPRQPVQLVILEALPLPAIHTVNDAGDVSSSVVAEGQAL